MSLIELTYYHTKFRYVNGKRTLVYSHQQINVKPSSIKWMVNNSDGRPIQLHTTTRRTTPNTKISIDGLGTVLVKEKRTDIKKKMSEIYTTNLL